MEKIKQLHLIVEGEKACFTIPENKTERLSYKVPTISALKGMLRQIYWKPGMEFVIDKIVVFNPIEWDSQGTNEVKYRQKLSNVMVATENGKKDLTVDINKYRTQRTSRYLVNVKYGITFHIIYSSSSCEKEPNFIAEHTARFKKSVQKGRAFRQMYFGRSNCEVSHYKLVSSIDISAVCDDLKGINLDLGFMFYDHKYLDEGVPVDGDYNAKIFSDESTKLYYNPHIVDGVIDVNKYRGTIVW